MKSADNQTGQAQTTAVVPACSVQCEALPQGISMQDLMLQLQIDILQMWMAQLRIAAAAANNICKVPFALSPPDTESIGWSSRICS